ncbi:MAG TPA: hypothetical protein VIK35_11100 [Verrucomicrobiae bacterium]
MLLYLTPFFIKKVLAATGGLDWKRCVPKNASPDGVARRLNSICFPAQALCLRGLAGVKNQT